MTESGVTEAELDAAEELRLNGQYSNALRLTQDMLSRVQDEEMRMRLLFDVICCSTRLGLDETTESALRELENLPQSAKSKFLMAIVQAASQLERGQALEALNLIDRNLASPFAERDDFKKWKYDLLVYRGKALTRLARCEEALESLERAHSICPEGEKEVAILIARVNCLESLDRFDEAFNTASLVLNRGDEDMKALALQYMAECRLGQGRAQEALTIYRDLQQRLPSRWTSEDRIQSGIRNAIDYLEKLHSQKKPF